jgi:y4mF family transcriptional regulator
MNEISNIAAFIKYSREKLNLTQEELADRAGVGIHFIRDLEQGRSALRLDKVNHVLEMFGHRLSVSSAKLDPYQMWYNYIDKPVKIIKKNKEEFDGHLVQEIRDEKSEIVAWVLIPSYYAMKWKKKRDDTLGITIKQNEIASIELQKGWKEVK